MTVMAIVISGQFLAVILSGGAAAMVGALIQAYKSIRDGSRTDDRDAFAESETGRKTEAKARSRAEIERDYWHRRAAVLEYQVISINGPTALPAREPWPEMGTDEEG